MTNPLVDREIKERMADGTLIIDPFETKHLNPASYDLTLSNKFAKTTAKFNGVFHNPNTWYTDSLEYYIDPRDKNTQETKKWEADIQLLKPGEFILGSVNETTGFSNDLCGCLFGKSSWARLGIAIHISAGFADNSWKGQYVLEIVNLSSEAVILHAGDKIAQVVFFKTEPCEEGYDQKSGSKYMNQVGVIASKYYENH